MKKPKEDKMQMNLSLTGTLKEQVEVMQNETFFRKSDIGKIALYEFFEGKQNEPAVMMNLIMMQQAINDMEDTIREDQKGVYEQLKQMMKNIMVIKGGK